MVILPINILLWIDFTVVASSAEDAQGTKMLKFTKFKVSRQQNVTPSYIQGVPKKMFPCLRGYNSGKNGTTIKSKVSFEIYMQFSF